MRPRREGGRSGRPLEPFDDPELDQRLPGYAEAPGLRSSASRTHAGKIDVDTPEREIWMPAIAQSTSPDTSSPASNFLSNSRAFSCGDSNRDALGDAFVNLSQFRS
jgi:hypothetical protein